MDFVVLCSSKGTVLRAVLEECAKGTLHARCCGLVTDDAKRGCIAWARQHRIPLRIVEHEEGEPREAYDRKISAAVRELFGGGGNEGIVACMGWMRILSPWFVGEWRDRILNVHPALLPRHPGAHAHELVLAAGDTESGMTVHLVDEGVDTGRIVLQKKCPVLPGDSVETLKARVQALECEWYPYVLQKIHTGEIVLGG